MGTPARPSSRVVDGFGTNADGQECPSYSLSDFIYPTPSWTDEARAARDRELRATQIAQPAIGAISLGALAVLFALAGIPALVQHQIELPTIIAELFVITGIILLTWCGRSGHWHERWLEYRTLAERLRLSRLMALLGGWRQQTAMPGHLATYGDPVNSWVHWHYRAVERAAGLPNGKMDAARLQETKTAFQEVLAGGQQCAGGWQSPRDI